MDFSILGFFVSGFWAVLKALFGKSDAERLGIAETTLTQQAKTLTEVQDVKDMDVRLNDLSDVQLQVAGKQWERPDS